MSTIVIGWETRNRFRSRSASLWCKNYGLSVLTREVRIGELTARERKTLIRKFEQSFTKATDRFFFLLLCDTCVPLAVLPQDTAHAMHQNQAPFEFVTVNQNRD